MSNHEAQPSIIEEQATPTISVIREHVSNNYYIEATDFFEKANIHTFITQAIIITLLFVYKTEILKLMQVLIRKIYNIKKYKGFEFYEDASSDTINEVDQKDDELEERTEEYEKQIHENPNMAFLSIFIEFESYLKDLYVLKRRNKESTHKPLNHRRGMLMYLISDKVLKTTLHGLHRDTRRIKNLIADGKKVFTEDDENFRNYLKAVLLLRDEVKEALDEAKAEQNGN